MYDLVTTHIFNKREKILISHIGTTATTLSTYEGKSIYCVYLENKGICKQPENDAIFSAKREKKNTDRKKKNKIKFTTPTAVIREAKN